MEQELWKEINGFNGKYEVSSFGRVRSYAQSKSGRILPGYTDAKGYITVCLYHAPQKGKFYKLLLLYCLILVFILYYYLEFHPFFTKYI